VDIAECIRELEVVVRLFVPVIEPILMNKRGVASTNDASSSVSLDEGKNNKKKEIMQLKDVQILRALFIKL
jgi:hypothetical protein